MHGLPAVTLTSSFSPFRPHIESFQEHIPSSPIPLPPPWFGLSLSPGNHQFFSSPKPLYPLSLLSPLALVYFSLDFQWSVISTTLSAHSALLCFSKNSGNQCPNKNPLAQASPLQACPGGAGRGSVGRWGGRGRGQSGLSIHQTWV